MICQVFITHLDYKEQKCSSKYARSQSIMGSISHGQQSKFPRLSALVCLYMIHPALLSLSHFILPTGDKFRSMHILPAHRDSQDNEMSLRRIYIIFARSSSLFFLNILCCFHSACIIIILPLSLRFHS